MISFSFLKVITFMALLISNVSVLCAGQLERFHFRKPVMGTEFQIICYAEDKDSAEKAAELAFAKAMEIEKICSDYKRDSEVRQLKGVATKKLSSTLTDVLTTALAIAKETDGAFDPTIGHHSLNWRRAKARGKLPTAESIQLAKQHTGWQKISVSKNGAFKTSIAELRIDLGGIAKGYAADKMLEVLAEHKITHAMIAAGGDLRLGNSPPNAKGWKVGLKNLKTISDKHITYLILSDCAISTSGDLHQFVEINGTRYSHIVNPQTGLGLTNRVSATVIAPTASQSDPLATAACISKNTATKLLASQDGIKLLLVTKAGEKITTQQSATFPNTLKK